MNWHWKRKPSPCESAGDPEADLVEEHAGGQCGEALHEDSKDDS